MVDSEVGSTQKKSLNFLEKKREAERIDDENACMLKRLQKVRPTASITATNLKK